MSERNQPGKELAPIWDGTVEALPGVARIAGSAWLRSAAWTLGAGGRSTKLLARTLTDPSVAGEFVQQVATDLSQATRVVSDVARAISNGVPAPRALMDAGAAMSAVVSASNSSGPSSPSSVAPVGRDESHLSLRQRGEKLLQRSRDVWNDEEGHPAYARLLDDLAPDEARILLLLLRGGPQPSVDVRTGGPVGVVSSALIAPGLNMIGPRAGTRYLDEVPAYLNNLNRLGLIWFSREQLRDPHEYQVVEAQPDVLAAMKSQRFTKVIRRSIHLTPFGTDFCTTCLMDPAQTTDLPAHENPDEVAGS